MARTREPIHPGRVLRRDFMVPFALSATKLGQFLRVPANRISDIVRGRRGISADTALRLERYFGFPARDWMELQNQYDLARAAAAAGREIGRIPRRVT